MSKKNQFTGPTTSERLFFEQLAEHILRQPGGFKSFVESNKELAPQFRAAFARFKTDEARAYVNKNKPADDTVPGGPYGVLSQFSAIVDEVAPLREESKMSLAGESQAAEDSEGDVEES